MPGTRWTARTVVICLAGLLGGWAAAGSLGLMGEPLRRGLTLLALGAVCAAAVPHRSRPVWRLLLLVAAAVAATIMVAASLPAVNVLAVVVALLAAATLQPPPARAAVTVVAQAVMLLAIYRLAYLSIGPVWYAADTLSTVLSRAAGVVAMTPFVCGPTLVGIDLLVVMTYVAIALPLLSWRGLDDAPRATLYAFLGLVLVWAVHFVYLCGLARATVWVAAIPEAAAPESIVGSAPPPSWIARVHEFVPTNLPTVAAMLHLAVAVGLLLFGRRLLRLPSPTMPRLRRWPVPLTAVTAGLLAAALPLATSCYPVRPTLAGKKIVMYEKGFLNWLKPTHGDYGRLGSGMYGMLPVFLESFGAKPLISHDLSEADLHDADALVLLYPNQPWEDGQLVRIRQFVLHGGGLLVLGDHTVEEKEGGARFNDVLEGTAMHVRFDTAEFTVGGWLQSYDAMAHPATAGIGDDQNQFGVVIGASVAAQWPARPLLIGRYGWRDRGDPNNGEAKLGNRRFDPGEPLGDVLLAAEQRVGDGKIVVFGDTSTMTNGLMVGCHDFIARLLAYVSDGHRVAQPPSRELLTVLLAALLLVVVLWPGWRLAPAVAALLMAGSLAIGTRVTHEHWRLLPDGRLRDTTDLPFLKLSQCSLQHDLAAPLLAANNLAYIDASHVNAYGREGWRDDGTMGLCLTLMRNGYLTFYLNDFSADQFFAPAAIGQVETTDTQTSDLFLRARILVEIAPGRPFSRRERRLLQRFVAAGGILIYTVGYEHIGPSRDVLADFGFRVGEVSRFGTIRVRPETDWRRTAADDALTDDRRAPPIYREPPPLGFFKSPYFRGPDYLAYVRFHTAWPVESTYHYKPPQVKRPPQRDRKGAAVSAVADPEPMALALYPADEPVIMARRYQHGLVIVVGDSWFATSQNLEREDGAAFDGMHENADFWRWLLALAADRPAWYPPNRAATKGDREQQPPPDNTDNAIKEDTKPPPPVDANQAGAKQESSRADVAPSSPASNP